MDEFDTLIALQGFTTDGYTDASDWQGFRGVLSAGFDVGERGRLRIIYAGYGSEWNAPDTIPVAAVEAGDIGFYGAIDESDGGESERHQASVHFELPTSSGIALEARAYFVRNRTKIFSNYTYYASYLERGDQDEQSDARWTYGLAAELLYAHHFDEVLLESTFGLGFRGDVIDMGIWRTTKRERWDTAARFDYLVHDLSAFARFELVPTRWVRVIVGARLDALLFDVDGKQDFQRPSGALDEDQPIVGTAERFVPQPKASVIFSPLGGLDLFVNFGTGFHSPDARDPVRNADSDVPLAYVGELGVRLAMWDVVDLALVGWGAYLEKETFFDPLLGRSVDEGQSRRLGFDMELRVRILDWLDGHLDLGYTDARLIDSGDEVPGSPAWMGALSLHARHSCGVKGGVRLRYVGSRALDKGQHGEDAWLLDVLVEYRWRFVAVGVSVENTLALRWKDAQFYYASRYDPEDTSDPTPAKHFTAGTPIAARGWLRLYF